jgi:nitrite reductase/ring-hydroxylating ferredoxin subunit
MPLIHQVTDATTTGSESQGCEECRARAARSSDTSQAGQLDRRQLDRRQFVAQSALAAVSAVLLSACAGGSGVTGPGGNGNTSLSVQVSSFPTLASVGGIARIDSGSGTPVAAVRTGATTFAAFSLICPHFGCTVGIAGSSFACPCHGARFAANGSWIGGQPTGNLSALTATYDATVGTLTITG